LSLLWPKWPQCWSYLFSALFLLTYFLRAPTAGGQYHWVSEFAPRSTQRFTSYLVGWLCVLGWQTGAASSAFLSAAEIQGLAILNYPNYVPKQWHLCLIMIAVTGVCGIFNTFLARKLPLVEGCVLILHILGFFAIMIPLWILAPRTDAKTVFTSFNNNGWSATGLSVLVGIISPAVSLIGSDSATHMAEEVKDASRVLPHAMITTVIFNGVLGFIMLLTMCFCLGDLNQVLQAPVAAIGVPFIQVFANGVQSNAGATVMTTILIILSTFCCITNIAAASRQLFAFARDKGVPFGSVLSAVPMGWEIPLNAIILTLMFSTLLSLIVIGSTTAYNNITSLGLAALLCSYMICIGSVVLRRVRRQPLLPRRVSLGAAGLSINLFSLAFLAMLFIFIFFPAEPKPTVQEMNWAVLIFGGVMIFSLVYFMLVGRKTYAGPVEYVRKLD
jgi:choline transport protein